MVMLLCVGLIVCFALLWKVYALPMSLVCLNSTRYWRLWNEPDQVSVASSGGYYLEWGGHKEISSLSFLAITFIYTLFMFWHFFSLSRSRFPSPSCVSPSLISDLYTFLRAVTHVLLWVIVCVFVWITVYWLFRSSNNMLSGCRIPFYRTLHSRACIWRSLCAWGGQGTHWDRWPGCHDHGRSPALLCLDSSARQRALWRLLITNQQEASSPLPLLPPSWSYVHKVCVCVCMWVACVRVVCVGFFCVCMRTYACVCMYMHVCLSVCLWVCLGGNTNWS